MAGNEVVSALQYVNEDGRTYPTDTPRWCGESGEHLNLTPGPGLSQDEIARERHGMWRYAATIGVDAASAVSLGEGWTPLLAGDWHGAATLFKLEFMMPTGSFKDRGMTVLVSYLRSRGVDHVLEDSSGNAGASLSAYAAAAGIRCRILVPETASYPKIAQIAACGADVVTIRGSRQDVADAAMRMSREIFYASHNWVPFFVEGTKTLAYELWEQLGFEAPDNVVVPLGYGSNVLGCLRGFGELATRGEIGRVPHVFAVQAENCAPYYAAWRRGVQWLVPIDVRPTIAEGIASSKPTRVAEVLNGVRESGGEIVAVNENEIVDALRELAAKGLYVEPTSAAAAAGLSQLVRAGAVQPRERTVLVLTGSGLKASERIGELLSLKARLIEPRPRTPPREA
jgi:threonine synthase